MNPRKQIPRCSAPPPRVTRVAVLLIAATLSVPVFVVLTLVDAVVF